MQAVNHCDILWVDDFDKSETVDNPRKYLKNYFPTEFEFRVKIETNFFNALADLENNFANYSCIILDVNFIKGFNFDKVNDEDKVSREIFDSLKSKKIRFNSEEIVDFGELEEYEKDIFREAAVLYRMYDILRNNNVIVDGALNAKNIFDDEIIDFDKIRDELENFEKYPDFKKNAGYYLFLYLLQRGMPQNHIAMLTANKVETSEEWEKNFRKADIQPPKAFDRKQCELTKKIQNSKFTDWLNDIFMPSYRLRACMIAMTAIIKDLLEDEDARKKLTASDSLWNGNAKDEYKNEVNRSDIVRNFHPEYVPCRLPENDEKKSAEILLHFISQIIIPWDDSEDPHNEKYSYYATMRTARN